MRAPPALRGNEATCDQRLNRYAAGVDVDEGCSGSPGLLATVDLDPLPGETGQANRHPGAMAASRHQQ